MIRLPLSLLLVLLPVLAQQVDPISARGFDHFYNLEYPEAIADFRKALAEDPNDPNRWNHLAQGVLFTMMFRNGALESELVTGSELLRRPKMNPTPAEERDFQAAIAKSIELNQAQLDRDPRDADALYSMGVAIGLKSNYLFLVKKDWLEALSEATTARKMHNDVMEIDPSRIDARLMQGLHDYVVGSLPWAYRMLGFLAGFHGDRDEGIRTLQLVAEQGKLNRTEAQIFLGVVYRREKRPREALPILDSLLARYPRNFLFLFEKSQMYADLGDKENALAALEEIRALKKSAAPGYKTLPVERIEFARGNLLYWYDDQDGAIASLRAATAKKGALEPAAGAQAWLRLGQCLDLKGQREEARKAYHASLAYAPDSEAGKESKRYLGRAYSREDFDRARQP
jgi:tetratricopeptide (TPR) repeat protein